MVDRIETHPLFDRVVTRHFDLTQGQNGAFRCARESGLSLGVFVVKRAYTTAYGIGWADAEADVPLKYRSHQMVKRSLTAGMISLMPATLLKLPC